MKKMHWLGVVATSLISASTLAGCSGDDAPPVNAGGSSSSTAGTGTSGTGTTAGTGTGGTGGGSSNVGVQLTGIPAYTILTAAEAPAGAAPPAAYNGAAICGTCHGMNAQGTDGLAPEIRHTPAAFFKGVVRAGRKDHTGAITGMAAFPATSISDADLDAVSAWVLALPKPTTGEALYHSMCGNCHGPKMATGGGSPIKIQGATVANVDKFVRMGGTGTDVNDRKTYMPAYDTTLLTDAELTLIKQFIGAI